MPPATVATRPCCSMCDRRLRNEYASRRIDGDIVCIECYERRATWDATTTTFDYNTYNLGSKRKFGVEIETSSCQNYRSLHDMTIWGVKYDCSISGMEFVSPILEGDKGLDTITDICEIAKARRWKIDGDCGLHIHLDMRNEKRAALKSIAYAYLVTEKLWATFVASHRVDNGMCRQSPISRGSLAGARRFTAYARGFDRFEWLNIASYVYHGTFEIRSHQGSLNAREIRYWIMAHLCFIDAVKGMDFNEIDDYFADPWAALRRCWGEPRLSRYYGRKRAANRRLYPTMEYA